MHPLNPFRGPHDLASLPGLAPHIRDGVTLDFGDPVAVRALNRALLEAQYGIAGWDFPADHLTPAVPGRLDYLLHVADLIDAPAPLDVLDLGTGASCVYPLLGAAALGWRFLASDIDPGSVATAQAIAATNPRLAINVRHQPDPSACFHGVVGRGEVLDLVVCNPPFYADAAEAAAEAARKGGGGAFAGKGNELHCDGGEHGFLHRMARESRDWGHRVFWFSALVAKKEHVGGLERSLRKLGATRVEVLPLAVGQKVARVVAWTFLPEAQQREWRRFRW